MRNCFMVLSFPLLLLAPSAQAEWVIAAATGRYKAYVDPATIRASGDRRRVFALYDLSMRGGGGQLSERLVLEFACTEERMRVLSFTYHAQAMGAGETTHMNSTPGDWQFVAPGTVNEAFLNLVCTR